MTLVRWRAVAVLNVPAQLGHIVSQAADFTHQVFFNLPVFGLDLFFHKNRGQGGRHE